MADPPGRRRRAQGPRARRRAEELALAHRARARLERVLPRAAAPVSAPPLPAGPLPDDVVLPDDVPTDDLPGEDVPGEVVPPEVVPPEPPRLGRAAVVGVVLVCLVGLAAAGVHLLRARPAPVDVPRTVRSVPPSAAATATGAAVVVDVAGAVRRPGVYTLPAGSRVGEALARAGGAAPGADTSSLNLARVLADGEQVLVPKPGAAASGATAPAAGGGAAGAVVDLNAATLEQLESLPGVGPVLAQRILDWRGQHGRFSTVDELREVSGVGDRKFAELKPLVRV